METLDLDVVNSKLQLTEKHLDTINDLIPASLEKLELSDLVAVRFRATDNLLNRSYGKWAAEALPVLQDLLIGLPLTLDHDWEDISKIQALIFDSKIRKYQAPEWAIDRAGNKTVNSSIIRREGYLSLEFDAVFPVDSPAVQALRFGKLNSVSLGGFEYEDHVCPLCNTSFDDDACPHLKPDKYWGVKPGLTYETAQGLRLVAPYFVRVKPRDLGEASLVVIPNYPAAGAVTAGQLKDLINAS